MNKLFMCKNKCAIVPKEIIEEERIKNAFFETKQRECQFSPEEFPAKYEHEDEYFCLLHLPYKSKEKYKVVGESQEKFRYLWGKETNFNFVVLHNIEINSGFIAPYHSFIGSTLWSINLQTLHQVKEIDFSYSKINGINIIRDSTFDRITIQGAEISSYLEFRNIIIRDNIIIRENIICFEKNILRLDDYNYGLIFTGLTAKNIYISNNDCKLPVKLSHCNLDKLYLNKNIFYQCPIISKYASNEINELILPEMNDFNFELFSNQHGKSDKKTEMQPWKDQYRKFREIYNLAKERDMYIEQSSYFHLMQKCIEKSYDTPIIIRISSSLYKLVCDYGSSISRPLYCLISIWFIFTVLFSFYNIGWGNSFFLATQQIIRPYSLFHDNQQKNILNIPYDKKTKEACEIVIDKLKIKKCDFQYSPTQKPSMGTAYVLSITESTLSLIFLALLLLSLRWNFRKG